MTTTLSLPSPETIHRTVLDNGIVVLVYENHSTQSVVMSGSFYAGSMYEDPAKSGLASFTAASLMRGTQNRDFNTIASQLEDIGADLDIGAGTHRGMFGGKALAEDLDVLLDILSDSLRNPIFPQEQVERLRGERLTWLSYSQQNTRYRASRAFREHLYPQEHPYHRSTRGSLETLPTISIDDMRAFQQKHYGPRDMRIAIVGAVNAGDVVAQVQQYFADWHNPDQPNIPNLPEISSPTEIKRVNTAVAGKTQSDLILGTIGPSRFAPDYQAANVANSIFGQFGMMGRIGDVVREREGMAYYAYSQLEGGTGPGAWSVAAGVNPSNVERAVDLCREEIRHLVEEPVSEEELDENQSYMTGRLPLQLESNEGLASTLHSMEVYGLGLDYLVNYHDMIYGLTRDDLHEAAKHYLNPDALVVSVAGPEIG